MTTRDKKKGKRLKTLFSIIVLFLFGIFCAKFSFAIPADGLVLHITFDGCTVMDETGHVSIFEIHGDPDCVEGIHGNAFYFDGDDKDEYECECECEHRSEYMCENKENNDWIGADAFYPIANGTIIMFIKIDDLPDENSNIYFLSSKTKSASDFALVWKNNSPYLNIGRLSVPFNKNYLDKWIMLTYVYDNGTSPSGDQFAYINANLVAQGRGKSNEDINPSYGDSRSANLNIGSSSWYNSFLQNTTIDEIIFYDRPLSQEEIQQIYQEFISSNGSSNDNFEEGFEEGKRWCREHPRECGIEIPGLPLPARGCAATFDMFTNTLRIPNFENRYWLELKVINWDPVQLELKRYGPLHQSER